MIKHGPYGPLTFFLISDIFKNNYQLQGFDSLVV